MVDYEQQFKDRELGVSARQTALATTFKIVYGWMSVGLVLSAVVAWYTAASGLWQTVLAGPGFYGCIIAELVVVLVLSAAIMKLPVWGACLLFLGYAALNGLTLSVVFIAYELASIERVFLITAGMFGGLAVWGTVTKGDLSKIGSVCGMALWGLIVARLVNIFMQSSASIRCSLMERAS